VIVGRGEGVSENKEALVGCLTHRHEALEAVIEVGVVPDLDSFLLALTF
jgi:hypothetical protein